MSSFGFRPGSDSEEVARTIRQHPFSDRGWGFGFEQTGVRSGFALDPHPDTVMADSIGGPCAVVRFERVKGPVGSHEHVDGSILPDQNSQISRCQLRAVRRNRGFEDALGIRQEIRHTLLIETDRRMLSRFFMAAALLRENTGERL